MTPRNGAGNLTLSTPAATQGDTGSIQHVDLTIGRLVP